MHAVTKFVLCLGFGLGLMAALPAEIPAGYYNSTETLSGSALKARLHDIIKGHQVLSYEAAYQALIVLDRHPNDPSAVVGIYSGFKMDGPARSAGGGGWNREHVWPKSFGNFGTETKKVAGTDLHHLRAEDSSTNSARNNRSFANGGDPYEDRSGTYRGPTANKTSGARWTWEPRDEVKGDVARMMFYMAVRYEGSEEEPDLELSEQVTPNNSKKPSLGVLSDLLSWHRNDPVDTAERARNDRVYLDYQGNRNPFVDQPDFVEKIWGSANQPSPFSISSAAEAEEEELQQTIQVGTFNLYWIGSEMRYGQGLRTEEDVKRLADLVTEELDLEIVVFEEVNTSLNGRSDGKRQTDQEYKWLKSLMEAKGYKLVAGTTGGAQRVVIAYDSDEVQQMAAAKELDVRTSFTLPGGCSSSGLRKPLAAQFKAGKFDFWVVGVHLKSQRGGDCSDAVRSEQSEDLLLAIEELTAGTGEKDIIIAGDFNAGARDISIGEFYRQGGFTTLTWPGRMSPASGEFSYLPEQFASIIDHLMVRSEHTTELVLKSTTVYKPEDAEDYIKNYSDHAPVWASFSIEVDDDH